MGDFAATCSTVLSHTPVERISFKGMVFILPAQVQRLVEFMQRRVEAVMLVLPLTQECTAAISNSKFLHTTDEDFATAKAPPNKKARASLNECPNDKTRKSEAVDSVGKAHKERYVTSFIYQCTIFHCAVV